ncbi:MAG: RNA polymerase sigma factor [Pseudomonadota bacterium]
MADYSNEGGDFETAYRSHFERVRRFSQRVVGCGAVAEDVTQEAFLKWLSKLAGATETAERHIPLLYRIAKGLSIDTERRRKNILRLHRSLPTQPHMEPSSERMYLALEDARRIEQALLRMVPMKRDAFLLRRIYGMPFREIAEKLCVSTSHAHHLAIEAMIDLDDVLTDLQPVLDRSDHAVVR